MGTGFAHSLRWAGDTSKLPFRPPRPRRDNHEGPSTSPFRGRNRDAAETFLLQGPGDASDISSSFALREVPPELSAAGTHRLVNLVERLVRVQLDNLLNQAASSLKASGHGAQP